MQRYNPSEIEPKWQKVWEDQKVNQVTEDPSKVKTYVSGMFPYPSGAGMHTGHAFSYSIVDAIARFHRQLGHNVLNPMGWDTFGLPAENYAIKTGTSPAVATRENIANFKKQFKRMGVSIDWSREINTSDPEYYKWTQWVFTKLFERGLAYQKESLQWWCPVDKTVLANEQVEAGRCWRCGSMVEKKSMKQWFFKITEYADALLEEIEDLDWPQKIKTAQTNWIGRSQGAEVQFTVDGRDDIITVFTTRPDTIFGATFVVLAPEHPLVETLGVGDFAEPLKAYVKEAIKKSEIDRTNDTKEKTGVFTGSYAINPATGERVPIWVADYVLGGYGTGAIMAVPAHDERDLAFAEKYKLPVVDVIGEQTDNEGTLMNSGQFDGTSTFDAREQIVAWLEEQGVGKSQTTYKMRDWLISRQRYWGAPIPIIHCEHCKKRIEQDAHEINFYNQDTWNKILSRKKTIESRADNPEEPERRFADIKVGDYLKFVNKVSGDAQWAKVRTVLRFDNIAELYKDVERTAAICGGEVPLSPAELERMYAELTPGYADKINKNGLIAWEFDLITPGVVPVPEDQLPVVLPEIEDFAPKGDGKSALARAEDWVNTTCPECGKPALRETDTMDGYACSSWYLLRYADPHNADRAWDPDKVNYWNPLDFYIGGDHAVAHLLYVRFWTHVFYDMGLVNFKEPVKKLIYHGYINAEDGSKMSKSKGNVIDPLDVIEQGYGADALRTYVLFMGPIELDATWSSKGIAGVYRFLNRVWTLSQEFMAAEKGEAHDEQAIRVAQHKTIRKVTDDFRRMSFNTAISALMEYTNDLYKFKTDGFSEAVWPEAITALVQMIAPFAPHMADELWSQLGNEGLIQKAGWPTWDESLTIDDIISIAIQVNGKLRGEISVAKDTAAEQVKTLALEHENVAKFVGENEPAKVIYVPGRLVSIVTEA